MTRDLLSCLSELDAKLRLHGPTVVPEKRVAGVKVTLILADVVGTLPDRITINENGNVVLYWFGGETKPDGGRSRVGSLSIENGGMLGWVHERGSGDFFDVAVEGVEAALAKIIGFAQGGANVIPQP